MDGVVLRNAANELARLLRERLERRVCGPAEPDVSRVRKNVSDTNSDKGGTRSFPVKIESFLKAEK